MRTTLRIDDDVLDAARALADSERRHVGAVISDLARRALRPTLFREGADFPTFDVPLDAPPMTSAHVARALDED